MFFCLIILFISSAISLLFVSTITTSICTCKRYMIFLLKLFEFGQEHIEKQKKCARSKSGNQLFLKNGYSNESHIKPKGFETQSSMGDANITPFYKDFNMWSDVTHFLVLGIEAVIEDEVTKRFHAEELTSWNFLTRTNKNYIFVSLPLSILWCVGCIFRYGILFPLRLIIFVFGVGCLILSTVITEYIPNMAIKQILHYYSSIFCFQVMSRSISAIVTYHYPENKAKPGGICVANHTSPLDILILSCDGLYTIVGQAQTGFLGFIQKVLSRVGHHIWFDRFEEEDKKFVIESLKSYCSNVCNPPMLVFPEGTCINNTSVMMFKKGSFEVESRIYPTTIKYDPQFGDPFWDSSKYSWLHYFLRLMTSWATVCEVWYLPPMDKEPGECAIKFANRVKEVIARQGDLVNLDWDGQLKRMQVKQNLKELKQLEYSQKFKFN